MSSRLVPPHPGASSEQVSRRMSRARRRDISPELALRWELHARGHRFRVVLKVPGNHRRTIDIAFTKVRLAVFVDGCFWHGCPEHGNLPMKNTEWWSMKLAANQGRDRDTDAVLEASGWQVLRTWEHVEARTAADLVEERIRGARLVAGPPLTN